MKDRCFLAVAQVRGMMLKQRTRGAALLYLATALLAVLLSWSPLVAQQCDERCTDITEALVRWAAEKHNAPLGSIVVDTVYSGEVPGSVRGAGRKAISASHFSSLQARTGVRLGSRPEILDCGPPVSPPRLATCLLMPDRFLVSFRAPVIDGDTAIVNSLSVSWTATSRFPGVSPRIQLYIYVLKLTKRTDRWQVTGVTMIGQS
jgi:hypothetical protein